MLLRKLVIVVVGLRFLTLALVSCGPNDKSGIIKAEAEALPDVAPSRDVIVQLNTRLKSSVSDTSNQTPNGKTLCRVPSGTRLTFKENPKLASDRRHYTVNLSKSIAGCEMMSGYFYGPHLMGSQFTVDNGKVQKLVNAALENEGYRSAGLCYTYVGKALDKSGVMSESNWALFSKHQQLAADGFAEVADDDDSNLLKNIGYRRVYVDAPSAPVGSVLVYPHGKCGAHPTWGHIEIAVGGARACSDFCAPIRTNCEFAHVYAPVN